MQSLFKLQLILFISTLVCKFFAYDLMFNTDMDLNYWKFNGSYIYTRTLQDMAALVPASLVRSSKGEAARKGLWLIRNNGPEADNFLTLGYSLHHHLLFQGVVQFIATPDVPMTVSTEEGEEIGKYWSDEKSWCDAIFTVNMIKSIKINIETPNSGNYALIDKVILGVQGNVTQLNSRTITPCSTTPPTATKIDEEDMAPDMAQKSTGNRARYQPQPEPEPDMARKPAYHGHAVQQGAPDMAQRQRGSPTPRLDTRTTTDNENGIIVDSDSSEVKCGCSCSCSRQKKKPANATMIYGQG